MAKNVRVSDSIYSLAQMESVLKNRSIAQQVEYWAKLGMASEGADARLDTQRAMKGAVEATRRLDILDVRTGKRSADSLHFIPRSIARNSKPVFPAKFRKD